MNNIWFCEDCKQGFKFWMTISLNRFNRFLKFIFNYRMKLNKSRCTLIHRMQKKKKKRIQVKWDWSFNIQRKYLTLMFTAFGAIHRSRNIKWKGWVAHTWEELKGSLWNFVSLHTVHTKSLLQSLVIQDLESAYLFTALLTDANEGFPNLLWQHSKETWKVFGEILASKVET